MPLPPHDAMRSHMLSALGKYWATDGERVVALPIEACAAIGVTGPLELQAITLPDWARAGAVDGRLLVPVESALAGDDWRSVDWWTASFMLLEAWHERAWERAHGPIHSYSTRLRGWDERAWDHAWVNRIGLLLANWAGLQPSVNDSDLRISHDVDAVSKTGAIRLKQGAMRAAVALRRGTDTHALDRSSTRRFLLRSDDWFTIDAVLAMERQRGLGATFNLFADPRRPSPRRWLMDPGYRLDSDDGRRLVASLSEQPDIQIGLHPSFDSWEDQTLLAEQRAHLERHVHTTVTSARQHWLRFSWASTWRAQRNAGLELDATLMFNDRAGFRNSAALEWHPWDPVDNCAHSIRAVPCCFMDSHQYDYAALADGRARPSAGSVIAECRSVGGSAELLWHPHTLSHDYGWAPGFESLLDKVAA